MKVQEVKLDENKRRYLLLDSGGIPVMPVAKYLKYLDNTGKSSKLLNNRPYCGTRKNPAYFNTGIQIKFYQNFISKLQE